jgi:purine-binding chemotaxis protein CheW
MTCALPLASVIETMRPLPVDVFAGAPRGVRGVSLIRGEPLPVVELAALLGSSPGQATRFVTLRVGARRVALAVDEVLGVRALPRALASELPPLLHAADGEVVSALARVDASLVRLLDSARLLSTDDLAAIDAAMPRATGADP